MSITVEVTTTVLPGHRVEVSAPELPEGRAATVRITVEEPSVPSPKAVNPDLRESERLYYQDLPQLLETRAGRWVAYTPQGCIAEGDDEMALFRECARRGLQPGHFLVARVEPDYPVLDFTGRYFVEE